MPTVTPSNDFTVEHPAGAPILTVTLPTPEVGNTDSTMVRRVVNQTRNLERRIFRDPQATVKRKFSYRFRSLTLAERNSFVALLEASLGQLVRITDHESIQYDGLISNPNVPNKAGGDCKYEVGFDFEGSAV